MLACLVGPYRGQSVERRFVSVRVSDLANALGLAPTAGSVDGTSLCRMFRQAIRSHPVPKYRAAETDGPAGAVGRPPEEPIRWRQLNARDYFNLPREKPIH